MSRLNLLSTKQRATFYCDGFLFLPRFINDEWLTRLNNAADRAIEDSRSVSKTNDWFDLESDHSVEKPRLRRLMKPQDYDPVFWELASQGPFADLAADLLGPNVKFHHGKLNYKWSDGGAEVKWHQDIPFWPHTSYNVLTIGVALDHIDETMGPMGVIPGSHKGPIYNHYDPDGRWQGFINDDDLDAIATGKARYNTGSIGTVTVHHCRAVHGSQPNLNPIKPRPLLLFAYSKAASLPIMPYNQDSQYNGAIVRGKHPKFPEMDMEPCPLPPLKGQRSIFESQQI